MDLRALVRVWVVMHVPRLSMMRQRPLFTDDAAGAAAVGLHDTEKSEGPSHVRCLIPISSRWAKAHRSSRQVNRWNPATCAPSALELEARSAVHMQTRTV